jgi:vesicle transport protein GOT1
MLAMGNVSLYPPLTFLIPQYLTLLATQILFLIGLTLIIGLQKTLAFFARRQKLKGTAAFAAGILLILLRWPLIGFCVELYGIFVLFGDFLATIAAFVQNVPVIGPIIAQVLEKLGGVGRRNAELPV